MSRFVTFYKLKKFFEEDDKLKYESESLSFNGLFFSNLDFFQRKTIFAKFVMPQCYKDSNGKLHENLNIWYPYEVAEIVGEMEKVELEELSQEWSEEFLVSFEQILMFFQSASNEENFVIEEISY